MASYLVLEPAPRGAETGPVFVRDGFAVLAFVVPPLWLAWHRLWWPALATLLASVALALLGELAGLGMAASAISLLMSIYVGLEGRSLRAAGLERRGWHLGAVVEADNLADAELRYFTASDSDAEAYQASPIGRHGDARPILGLLGYSGKA